MAGSVGSQRHSNVTCLLTRYVPRPGRCDNVLSFGWTFQLGMFLFVLTTGCCVLPSQALGLISSRSSLSRTRIHATKADTNRDASETFQSVNDSIETFKASSPPPPSPILTAADMRRSEKWEGRFRDLMAFKERYGHTNVPQYPTKAIPEDHRVSANFCRNCRTQYNYHHDPDKQHLSFLTDDRIQRLEEIGFCWNTREATWQLRWKELQEFSNIFGHSNVPARWSENKALAAWVATQRQKYRAQQEDASDDDDDADTATWAAKKYYGKELTQRHIQLLESVGFCWDPHRDHWWMMYDELRDFWQKHNHVKVPRGYAPNPKLPSWIVHQRRYCREYLLAVQIEGTTDGVTVSGLDFERLEALRAIDFFSGLEPERLKALRAINFCWLPDIEQESNE
jgi:hypothetical protein